MRNTMIMAGGLAILVVGCTRPASDTATVASAAKPASAAAVPVTSAVTPPATAPHWDYEADGPAKWSALSPKFSVCSEGQHQSPVDIRDALPAQTAQLRTNFKPAELRVVHHEHMSDVVNTGHSIQVNGDGGDTITIGDERFVLLQYHFHSPSEHQVNGRVFPAEMHLVHKAADGRLAVIGVLFEDGAENKALDPIWSNLPATKGEENHLAHLTVNADNLLPVSRASWRYEGSLTTPPCAEGVTWIVMKKPVQMSKEQLARLRSVLKPNNRPVQTLNGRKIVLESIVERAAGG